MTDTLARKSNDSSYKGKYNTYSSELKSADTARNSSFAIYSNTAYCGSGKSCNINISIDFDSLKKKENILNLNQKVSLK